MPVNLTKEAKGKLKMADYMKIAQAPRDALMMKMMSDLLEVHTKFVDRAEDLKKILRTPGPQGQRGEKPTPEEIATHVKEHLSHITDEHLAGLIKKHAPKPKDGVTPIAGVHFTLPEPQSIDHDLLAEKMLEKLKGKISAKDISGLDETMRAHANQTKQGYLHGAGITGLQAGPNVTLLPDGKGGFVISANGGASSGFQLPSSGLVNGVNKTFVFAVAPNVIVADQGRAMQKTSSDGTVNWTGTTTIILAVAPVSDIYATA